MQSFLSGIFERMMNLEMTPSSQNAKLSAASIIGAVFGFSLIIVAVMLGTSNYRAFFSIEGFAIVIGGTLAVAFMSSAASDVLGALKSIGLMFRQQEATHENLHDELADILAWARLVQEKGMRGLEDEIGEKILDPFVRYGLEMVVSNYTPDEVRTMMETAAESAYERDTVPAAILMAMASHAPAFGMVGTLIGMVTLLRSIGDDMNLIAAALAVCLLATLYGVISARLLYMPAASKVMQKQEGLRFRNSLIAEGMALLVANKSPRYIQDRLNSYLMPEKHHDMDIRKSDYAITD